MATKLQRFNFRLTEEQKNMIEQAAIINGVSVTSFVRSTLMIEAKKTLQLHQSIMLPLEDLKQFLLWVDEGVESSGEIQQLAKAYRENVKEK